eukprot:s5884_g5.t1
MVRHLKSYPAAESWEPSTGDIRSAIISRWMAVNPAPTWVIADSALYFSSSEFSDFLGRSGVGLLLAPGEARWLLGHEERRIQTLKRVTVEETFALACHGANSSINSSGFSPFQWAGGWQKDG